VGHESRNRNYDAAGVQWVKNGKGLTAGGYPLPGQLGAKGSTVTSPSGLWGRSTAKNENDF